MKCILLSDNILHNEMKRFHLINMVSNLFSHNNFMLSTYYAFHNFVMKNKVLGTSEQI